MARLLSFFLPNICCLRSALSMSPSPLSPSEGSLKRGQFLRGASVRARKCCQTPAASFSQALLLLAPSSSVFKSLILRSPAGFCLLLRFVRDSPSFRLPFKTLPWRIHFVIGTRTDYHPLFRSLSDLLYAKLPFSTAGLPIGAIFQLIRRTTLSWIKLTILESRFIPFLLTMSNWSS